jgi:S-adenosylmethionine hydrolase
MRIVTLTTDFGDGSTYVAAMKGALLAVNPHARILDLTHRLPPQDLVATAYFLCDTLPFFPTGTIHVVVVDPGVGTDRAILCVEWRCQIILVPDNGCWAPLVASGDPPPLVRRVEGGRYRRANVSATFHGRDIFAPAAGYMSNEFPRSELGPVVSDWVRMTLPQPTITREGATGQVVVVDSFGNLITNISADMVPPGSNVVIAGESVPRLVRTYGDAEPGALVALIGSTGRLEVAVVNGSAAARLGLGVGATVEVGRGG